MRTVVVSILMSALLLELTQQLNHHLGEWHLHLFLSGLLITFPALRLEHRHAWKCILFLGLLSDAAAPVPFGTHAFLFLIAHAILHKLRQKFPEQDLIFTLTSALAVNTALMLALTFGLAHRAPAAISLWPPVLLDLLLSSVAIIVLGPWTFALQLRALELAGASLRTEQRGLL